VRSANLVDIREIVRQLKQGQTQRQIGRSVTLDHKTVGRYEEIAESQGWLNADKALPSPEEIQAALSTLREPLPAQNKPMASEFAGVIKTLHASGVDDASVMHERLREGHGYSGSYWSVWRYMRKHIWVESREACLRVHTPPGEEAQVDFGDVGLMWDPVLGCKRKAYAFVMTLGWSRHQFVCHTFSQKISDWQACHMRAFAFFGGVPKRLVIDNLKSGISKACLEDPQLNRSYREFAEHYGFMVAPCPPRRPQQKGKVEAGVKYYKRNALAGRHFDTPLLDIHKADEAAEAWVLNKAGTRVHGTTRKRPVEQFEQAERACLQPLPQTPFETVTWKQVKLHRDCHVVFDYSHYSAPCRLIGQTVLVRATPGRIEILHNDLVVAVHTRASEAGSFVTIAAHLPQHKERLANAAQAAVFRNLAQNVGPFTQKVVSALETSDTVLDPRRSAARLVLLAEKYSPELLERACKNACETNDMRPLTVRTLIKLMATGWKGDDPDACNPASPAPRHARSPAELVPHPPSCPSPGVGLSQA
jgi:transposase